MKKWTSSETIALAKLTCVHCHGYGLRPSQRGKETPCNCVLRAIFRACYRRFRDCVTKEKFLSRIVLEPCKGKDRVRMYGRKDEEFIADFCLVSRRALDGRQYDIFRFHFLLGADWRLCCRRLGIDRGTFFHEVYRIEQALGRIFAELEPYALFPLDEYFAGTIRGERTRPVELPVRARRGGPQPVRPPLAELIREAA